TDFAVVAGLLDGVVGVVENIEKNLLELLRITDSELKIFVEFLGDFDTVTGEVIAAEADGLPKDCVDLHRLALSGTLPGKAEKALNDFLGALRFAKNDLQFLTSGSRNLGILEQQIGEAENGGEGIVDFVSDAGDQAANGGHFFGVGELGLQEDGVGNIGHDYDDAVDLIGFVATGTEADGEMAHGAIAALDAQLQIFDLLTVGSGLQGGFKILTMRIFHQAHQALTD